MINSIDKTKTRGRTRSDGDDTKRLMVEAALQTLREEGYSGATARRIASQGGFNAPLIFYHFGGVEPLLLEALTVASERRLKRYQDAIGKTHDAVHLIEALARLWGEDAESAEVAAMQELVSAPEFFATRSAEIAQLLDPIFAYGEEVIGRFIVGTPIEALIAPRDAAFAAVSFMMGLEKMGRLDPDGTRTTALFDAARIALSLVGPFLGGVSPPEQRPPESGGERR